MDTSLYCYCRQSLRNWHERNLQKGVTKPPSKKTRGSWTRRLSALAISEDESFADVDSIPALEYVLHRNHCRNVCFLYRFQDFDLGSQGLVFLGLAVGNVVAFMLVVVFSRISYRNTVQAINAGKAINPPPEKRLLLALIGSIFVPVGLFWCGWSARPSVHWIVSIVGSAIFAFGNFLVFVSYLAQFSLVSHVLANAGSEHLVQ